MDKTILITGAAGFIGSNLVHHIRKVYPNTKIISYDKLTYAGNLANLESVKNDPLHTFVHGDICDATLLHTTLEKHQPDAILHLAAETHVDKSISNSSAFIQTNILGQETILNASLHYYKNAKSQTKKGFRFIHISTDEVFGELSIDDPKFNERTPYAPRSPYAASKAASDHLTRSWNYTYNLPVVILNCSNNYGPYQYPEKLIPLIINNALKELPLPVYGDGKQIRDWLYVDDHCAAILCALNRGKNGETYCVGGNNEIRNIDLVTMICNTLDATRPRSNGRKYADLIQHVKDRPGHDYRYSINTHKIETELNWNAGTAFANGINKTITWYLNNLEWCEKVNNEDYRNWIASHYVNSGD